jgi:hypothetical protein
VNNPAQHYDHFRACRYEKQCGAQGENGAGSWEVAIVGIAQGGQPGEFKGLRR